MHKELIGWAPLAYEPADAIEALQAEHEQMAAADLAVASLKEDRDTLRHKLDGANIGKWEVRYQQVLDQNHALKAERNALRKALTEALAQPVRVPLSYEQIAKIIEYLPDNSDEQIQDDPAKFIYDLIRTIERAHHIGGDK